MNTYVEPWEKSEDTNYLSTFFIMIIYKKKKLRQECNFHLEKLIANNQPKQSLHCDSQKWNKKQITTGFSFTCVLYTTSPPADATTHIFPFVMDSTATIRFSLWEGRDQHGQMLWTKAFIPLRLLTSAAKSSSLDHLRLPCLWVSIPALIFTCCVTLEKLLNLSKLSFLICKLGKIVVFSWREIPYMVGLFWGWNQLYT